MRECEAKKSCREDCDIEFEEDPDGKDGCLDKCRKIKVCKGSIIEKAKCEQTRECKDRCKKRFPDKEEELKKCEETHCPSIKVCIGMQKMVMECQNEIKCQEKCEDNEELSPEEKVDCKTECLPDVECFEKPPSCKMQKMCQKQCKKDHVFIDKQTKKID